MKIQLTELQAKDLNLLDNREFIRAAFYTGHSLIYIQEHLTANVYARERADVINLAKSLGMTDADTVE